MRIELQEEIMTVHTTQHFAGPVVKNVVTEILNVLSTGKVKTFIIDFNATDLIDSSGIGSLVSLAKEFRGKAVDLVLRNLDTDIFQLFEDTGLDKIFTIEKNGGVRKAEVDLFESAVDIRLNIKKEPIGEACIFAMSGVLNHPLGSSYFKQQLLLSLAQHKRILLDFDELTFFDSLSLSAVLNMNNLLKGTGGSLRICSPNYIVKDLLSTLSIDLIIPLFESRNDALKDWS
jgi:anti-anti-sigma factor